MKKILYYAHDKRYKDDFRPVYMEAPLLLWGLYEITALWMRTEILFYYGAKSHLKVMGIIEDLNV